MDIIKTRDEIVELLFDEATLRPSRFTIDEADEIATVYCWYLEDCKRGYSLVTRDRINNLKFIPDVLLQLYLSYALFVLRFWSRASKIAKHISLKYTTKFFCSLYLNYVEHRCKWIGVINGVRACLKEKEGVK